MCKFFVFIKTVAWRPKNIRVFRLKFDATVIRIFAVTLTKFC